MPQQWLNRLAAGWGNTENGLFRSLERRSADRAATIRTQLDRRRADEIDRFTTNLDRLAGALRQQLVEADTADSELALFTADVIDPVEAAQLRRDRQGWRDRSPPCPPSGTWRYAASTRATRTPADHLFPVAVIFVVPTRMVTR